MNKKHKTDLVHKRIRLVTAIVKLAVWVYKLVDMVINPYIYHVNRLSSRNH